MPLCTDQIPSGAEDPEQQVLVSVTYNNHVTELPQGSADVNAAHCCTGRQLLAWLHFACSPRSLLIPLFRAHQYQMQ